MYDYGDTFYTSRHEATVYAANAILSIVREIVPEIRSAVDVGCGVGTWLSVLKDNGIEEIQGIDGSWVNTDCLVIPSECFMAYDLSEELTLPRKFDLAISLEVAEHLPSDSAATFVTTLTNLSEVVLFSAAIPGQGGVHHVNEHWPDYWLALFKDRGYVALDVIRPPIWNDEAIPFWYRQNALLFAKQGRLTSLRLPEGAGDSEPLSVVHPEMLRTAIDEASQGALRSFYNRVTRKAKRVLKRRLSRLQPQS